MHTVYRLFVEKRQEFNVEGQNYFNDIKQLLNINIEKLRLLYRYDIQGIDDEILKIARNTIFSEPAQDLVYDESLPDLKAFIFGIEYLPGQFDQRSDSAAQCIQII